MRQGAPLPQPSREERPEFQHPAPDRFVGQVGPTFGKELLDIAVAECEAQIDPDRVLDDLGREAMAAVGEGGHAVRIAQFGQPYRRRDNAIRRMRVKMRRVRITAIGGCTTPRTSRVWVSGLTPCGSTKS